MRTLTYFTNDDREPIVPTQSYKAPEFHNHIPIGKENSTAVYSKTVVPLKERILRVFGL